MLKFYDLTKKSSYEDFMKIRRDFRKKEYLKSISIRNSVSAIIDDVLKRGDAALLEYTEKFDRVKLSRDRITLSKEEIEAASSMVDDEFKSSYKKALENVYEYHKNQRIYKNWIKKKKDYFYGEQFNPIESVGAYIPGGSAPLVSTLMMICVPAKIAGVKSISVVTPPSIDGKVNPYILYACSEIGVDRIYRIGGAQAIGALAFGTETVRMVDKICGPGNKYVTEAKRQVFGFVGIDMLAGPSEVCIVADKNANPEYIACDVLSQAEHDPESISVVITDNNELAQKVISFIENMYSRDERKSILESSLKNSFLILVSSVEEGIAVANEIAPEHLELHVENIEKKFSDMNFNAGAVFLGEYTPVVAGDLYAGPNHVLPTSSKANFFSPLGVYDFFKRNSLLYYSKDKIRDSFKDIMKLADVEGLPWHRNSAGCRADNRKEP